MVVKSTYMELLCLKSREMILKILTCLAAYLLASVQRILQ